MKTNSMLILGGKTLGALALAVAACGTVNATAAGSSMDHKKVAVQGSSTNYKKTATANAASNRRNSNRSMKRRMAMKSGAFVKLGAAYNFADIETTGLIGSDIIIGVAPAPTGDGAIAVTAKSISEAIGKVDGFSGITATQFDSNATLINYSAYESKGSKFGFSGRVGYKFALGQGMFIAPSVGGSYLDLELDEDTNGNSIAKSDLVTDLKYNFTYDARLKLGVSIDRINLYVMAGYGAVDYDLILQNGSFTTATVANIVGTTIVAGADKDDTPSTLGDTVALGFSKKLSDTEYEANFGLGASYSVTSNIAISAEYNQILFDLDNALVASLNTITTVHTSAMPVTAATNGVLTSEAVTITSDLNKKNTVEIKDGNIHQFVISLEYTF